jgi:hypothetical protein
MRTANIVLLATSVVLAAAMINVPAGYYVADDFQNMFKPSPHDGWVREMISVGDAWFYGKTNTRYETQWTSMPWYSNDDCFGAGYGWNGCVFVKENGWCEPVERPSPPRAHVHPHHGWNDVVGVPACPRGVG